VLVIWLEDTSNESFLIAVDCHDKVQFLTCAFSSHLFLQVWICGYLIMPVYDRPTPAA